MNGRQDLEHDSQGNGKFLGDRCQAVAPKLPLPSFRRDGKLAMIRLFEDYVMPVVRSPPWLAPCFRSPRFLAGKRLRCWRFLLALKQQSSLVPPPSTVVRAVTVSISNQVGISLLNFVIGSR